MSWGQPVGTGKFVKLGDPSKEGFVAEAQGIYVGKRDGQYENQLYDFLTPDGAITIPGSAAISNTITPGMVGKLLLLAYEGEGVTKKSGKPFKKIAVRTWVGPLPAEYAGVAEQVENQSYETMPAALATDDDDDDGDADHPF